MSEEAEELGEKGKYSAAKFWVLYVVGLIMVLLLYKMCSTSNTSSQDRQRSRTKEGGSQSVKAPTAKKLKRA